MLRHHHQPVALPDNVIMVPFPHGNVLCLCLMDALSLVKENFLWTAAGPCVEGFLRAGFFDISLIKV
jgi:hypothetical protein